VRTPGGHRRYTRRGVDDVLAGRGGPDARLAEDAARLYAQGWSIRQVAERLGCGYGATRRMLRGRVALRGRGGARTKAPRTP